jgi:hypothetical protein
MRLYKNYRPHTITERVDLEARQENCFLNRSMRHAPPTDPALAETTAPR